MISYKNSIYLLGIVFFGEALLINNYSIAEDHTNFLTNLCHAAFNSEMTIAGKAPPNGMAEFTCNCFVEQVSFGYSVESAKRKCKDNASKEFNL